MLFHRMHYKFSYVLSQSRIFATCFCNSYFIFYVIQRRCRGYTASTHVCYQTLLSQCARGCNLSACNKLDGESYLSQHAFISWVHDRVSCTFPRLTELDGESYLSQHAFISWVQRIVSCTVPRLTELDSKSYLPQHAFILWVHRRVSFAVPCLTELFHIRERLNHAIPLWTVVIGRELFTSMAPQLHTKHTLIATDVFKTHIATGH
jgi:hypothetical protein